MQRIRTRIVAVLLPQLLLPAGLIAQPAAPLLKADLIRTLAERPASQEPVVALVRERCVAFSPTERDRQQLRALGATDALLEAMSSCGARSPRATSTRATPRPVPEPSLSRELAAPSVRPEPQAMVAVDLAPPDLGAGPPPPTRARPTTGAPIIDRPPQLTNAREVAGLLKEHYPPDLQRKGIGGTVVLRLLVDVDGRVADTRIHESSAEPALDGAALEVAARMRFEPARIGDTPIQTWTRQPVVFTAR